MKITELKLENFKNYSDEHFIFASGVNAICGPNGTGKTSIIEAISWAMFDFIPYKNQDNLIKITKSELLGVSIPNRVAKVEVTFVSDLDNKSYTIYRNTKRQHYIVNTETNERIAENKRELLPFLKKHYNLSSTANLEEIFIHTIGVPQGTFTSIFLDTPTNRKKVFDKVLNLEDYRKTFDLLKDFKLFINDKTNEVKLKIATYTTDVNRIPQYEKEIEETKTENIQIEKQIELINKEINNTTVIIDNYEKLYEDQTKLKTTIEKNTHSLNLLNKNFSEINVLLNESKQALDKINTLKPKYEEYIETQANFKELDEKKDAIDKLKNSINTKDKNLQNILNTIKNIDEKLEKINELKEQIKTFEPLQKQQEKLEEEKKELDKLLTQLKITESTLKTNKKEFEEKQNKLKELKEIISTLNLLKNVAKTYEKINNNLITTNSKLKELESSLKEHNEMANQVKGGLCPFLNEQCKNMQEGQDLHTYFINKIETLQKQILTDKTEKEMLEKDLITAKKASDEYKNLELKTKEQNSIMESLTNIEYDIQNNNKILDELVEVPERINKLLSELKKLGSPKDKINLLNEQISEETLLNKRKKVAIEQKTKTESEITEINDQVTSINFDEECFLKLKSKIIELEEGYKSYLKHEPIANKYEHFKKQAQSIKNAIKEKEENISELEKEVKSIESKYDNEKHKDLKTFLENTKLELFKQKEKIKNNTEKIMKLNEELLNLIKLKEKMESEQEQIVQYDKITDFINISRDIFKGCGSEIGKFYINNISIEANHLYQDITGNRYQELNWETDYEITIEENGYKRIFANLSGGEQMSAALAVRLALLKELSDINIAFFDEPTTNMDEIRRMNLAEQIKNLTYFDQLFVISHDDTFEKDIDNVIRLEN